MDLGTDHELTVDQARDRMTATAEASVPRPGMKRLGIEADTFQYPVIEVFGPTIQGEGILAGLPTYFVRFGGCDYRCSWCDSLYAVTPKLVRENAERLSGRDVLDRILELELEVLAARELPGAPAGTRWVTLSGGNPAILKLAPFVGLLHAAGFKVSVETQASKWREWLGFVDCLTMSPKPPSSGMVTEKHDADTTEFMYAASVARPTRHRDALKIVVFDDEDYQWAREFFKRFPTWPRFLSVGTDPPADDEPYAVTLVRIGDRYRWLCEKAALDPIMADARILPQCHVLAWGHARGV